MTSAKVFFRERNARIYEAYKGGIGLLELAYFFFIGEKHSEYISYHQSKSFNIESDAGIPLSLALVF